jgi:hypothetical protein
MLLKEVVREANVRPHPAAVGQPPISIETGDKHVNTCKKARYPQTSSSANEACKVPVSETHYGWPVALSALDLPPSYWLCPAVKWDRALISTGLRELEM